MVIPEPRQPEPLYWYQVGCLIGCVCTGEGKETYPTASALNCTTPAVPTNINTKSLTWNIDGKSPKKSWNSLMPWRSPGSSVL